MASETTDVKIAYRITAVNERLAYAVETAEALNIPKECIYLDAKRRGNIWNKFRIYEELKNQDSYTHVCMNDDDTIPVKNYKEIVETATRMFPDAIIAFYKPEARLKDRFEDSPYVQLLSNDCIGPGLVIPCKYLNNILQFYNKWLRESNYKWDDTTLKMWTLLNDIPVILTIPNLVYIRPLQSTVRSKNATQPNGECYIGHEINTEEFNTHKIKVMRTGRMFNPHLPKGHPLIDLCEKKFKENKDKAKRGFAYGGLINE